MASRKKPQSLNDSHYRLLQDLSNPRPPKPTSSPAFNPSFSLDDSEEESEPNVKSGRNDADDSMPRFSMISDSDSPAGGESLGKSKAEAKSFPRVIFSSDDESDEHNQAHPESIISDTIKKDVPQKVKMEGRRRLCKVSVSDDDNTNDQKLSELTDFDSPVVHRNHSEVNGNEDSNDIRDILNDLSSRLDLLSIEKKRVPRGSGAGDFKQVKTEIKDENVVAAREYETDASSFSAINELSYENESQMRRNKNKGGGLQRDEAKKVGMKQRSEVSRFLDEDEGSDGDCVLLNGKDKDSVLKLGKGKSKGKEVDDLIEKPAEEKGPFVLAGTRFTYTLPRNISTILYPHQLEGLKWLWFLHCKGSGGILGDDMGLGKTMQICGFLAGLFHSRLIKRALIVAPKTLLPHWIKELSVVGLSGKTKEYFGTCPKARQYELQYVLQDKGILLTTYDIVRNNVKSLRGDFYYKGDEDEDSTTWDYMILDEGHLIKNPSTQRAKSLLEIPSAHRIVISGTPIQNNLRELWALFSFCCPDLLGDRKEFKAKYEDLILRGNDKKASDREKRIGSTVAKDLRDRIQPYFLRRMKSEVFRQDDDDNAVAKLSKKNELIVWLRLTSCQRRLYEAYLNSEIVLSACDNSPLAALTILKKICDHPLILTKRAAEDVLEVIDSVDNPEDVKMAEKLAMYIAADVGEDAFKETHDSLSCKLSFIMSLLENLIPEGHKVLIFSQTRKMLNLVQDSLASSGYNYLRIDGTTKACDRVKVVNDFQEGSGPPIFLLTSQVGGLGLTLTEADRVIVVDPAWNPSTDSQSVDRAYRIGQKKDVVVYRLMTSGTVEEKIYRKQVFKGGLFKTATEHKEQMRYFSQQDLKDLFRLPSEGFDVSPTQQQLYEEHDKHHQMDESLKSHIEFLETLGIAGVSHHSLLYSKTAPVQITEEDVELVRANTTPYAAATSSWSGPTSERDVDGGAAYAFKPKDVNLITKKNQSPGSSGKSPESDIKEKIARLSHMLRNKAVIDRLPDKGEKIQKQILELNLELDILTKPRKAETEVIDLDEITGDFDKRLNL